MSFFSLFFTRSQVVLLVLVLLIHRLDAQEQRFVQINGFLEADHISYFKNYDDKINSRNQSIVQLELKSDIRNKFKVFSSIEIRNDLSDKSRDRVFLDEGYVDLLLLKNLDVRVGKQIINWGTADGINPTNNINPVDFSDILDTEDERIGVLALSSKFYLGKFVLEAVVVPLFTPSILPVGESRWLPSYPNYFQHPVYPEKVLKSSYQLQSPVLPTNDIRNGQYAAKVSTSLKGWDFSGSYFYGRDDLPSLYVSPVFINNDSIRLAISSRYQRLQVVGADFATTLGRIGVRGESAYFLTEDRHGENSFIDDPFILSVLSFDRVFSNVISNHNVNVLFQGIYQYITTGEEVPNTGLNHTFQRSLLFRAEYEISPYSSFRVQSLYDFRVDNYFIQPEFTHQLADGINFLLRMDFLGGKTNTFFGNFRNNDRVQLRLKYNF